KKTGTGGGSALSACSRSSLTGITSDGLHIPFIEPALIELHCANQCLRLYQPFDWYYPQPVGSSGETDHIAGHRPSPLRPFTDTVSGLKPTCTWVSYGLHR